MKTTFFRNWNWEHDHGEEPIDELGADCLKYAAAYHDDRGFPFRVMVVNPTTIASVERNPEEDKEVYSYDYFCDHEGRVVEKRSLNNDGSINIIIRIEYEGMTRVAEVGWSPETDDPPNRHPLPTGTA